MENNKEYRQIKNQSEKRPTKGRGKRIIGTGIYLSKTDMSFQTGEEIFSVKLDESFYKIFISNCTYLEAFRMSRRKGIIAFEWIKEVVAPFKQIVSVSQKCAARRCRKRCAGYGCLCRDGICL